MSSQRQRRAYPSVHFFFLLLSIYAWLDFRTSANAGTKGADRSLVHVALVAILVALVLFTVWVMARKGILMNPLVGFLSLVVLWIFTSNLVQNTWSWNTLVHLGLALLWVFVYYVFRYYIRSHPDAWSSISWFMTLMFIVYATFAFRAAYLIQTKYDRVAVVNLVYYVLVFLPWILLLPASWKRNALLFLNLIVVAVSMKRGAIVIFPIMVISFVFVDSIIKRRSSMVRIMSILLLFLFSLFVADEWTGGYLSARFSVDALVTGSGRTHIYGNAIADILHRTPLHLFFGLGSGSTIELLGTAAHNDLLEFLFSYGILGVASYITLVSVLFIRLRSLMKRCSPYAPHYAMAIVYVVIVGLFGQVYFSHSTLFIMALFGSIDALDYLSATHAGRSIPFRNDLGR